VRNAVQYNNVTPPPLLAWTCRQPFAPNGGILFHNLTENYSELLTLFWVWNHGTAQHVSVTSQFKCLACSTQDWKTWGSHRSDYNGLLGYDRMWLSWKPIMFQKNQLPSSWAMKPQGSLSLSKHNTGLYPEHLESISHSPN